MREGPQLEAKLTEGAAAYLSLGSSMTNPLEFEFPFLTMGAKVFAPLPVPLTAGGGGVVDPLVACGSADLLLRGIEFLRRPFIAKVPLLGAGCPFPSALCFIDRLYMLNSESLETSFTMVRKVGSLLFSSSAVAVE